MRQVKAKKLKRLAKEYLAQFETRGFRIPNDGLVTKQGSATAINRPDSERAIYRMFKRQFGKVKR